MNKDYLYKVYQPRRTTVSQYLFDGDFEGWFDTNLTNYWQSLGTPTVYGRGKVKAATDNALGNGVQLNGTTAYLEGSLAPFGLYGTGYSAFTYSIRFYRANWQDTAEHALVDHYREYTSWNGGLVKEGWGIYMNSETVGQLTFVCSLGSMFASAGGTKRSVNYALTNLAAGYHDVTIGSDGRFLRLWVDGVLVGSYDNVTNVGILDEIGTLTIGAQYKRQFTNPFAGNYAHTRFTDGIFDYDMFYNELLTDAQVAAQYALQSPQNVTNVDISHNNETITTIGSYTNGNPNINNTYENYNGTIVPALSTVQRALVIKTNTGGSAAQGVIQKTGTEINITGGNTYTGSCYVLAPVGETINLIITPTGGGSAQTVSVVATGAMQNIVSKYVSNIAATKLSVSVTMSNANASAKTFYIDRIALFSGPVAYDYFDENNRGTGSTAYSFDTLSNAHILSFNVTDYVATWRDVVSDFKYEQEINSGGSQLTITLARSVTNTGEGVDLYFGLQVRVYQIDSSNPTGKLVFNGTINNYIVSEEKNSIDVQLYGYGYELNNYLVTSGERRDYIMPLYAQAFATAYWGNVVTQTFTPTETIDLKTLYLMLDGFNVAGNRGVGISIYRGNPSNGLLTVIGGVATYDPGAGNTFITSGSGSGSVTASTPTRFKIDFSGTKKLYAGVAYFWSWFAPQGGNDIKFYQATDNSAVTPVFDKGYAATATINNASFGLTVRPQFYTELWNNTGSTTSVYNSKDPSAILRSILSDYQQQGGYLGYDNTSILDTGTLVSYDFKSVTTFEAVKKCLELAPAGWYFYIDQGENKVYFKAKSAEPQHKFIIGLHFTKLAYEKRTEEMVNLIYFTGGDVGGTNLFKVYEDTASIAAHGRRILNYSDNRVKLVATADTIANGILDERSSPEVRVPLEVLQNYPIDTIKPGDMVGIRNSNGLASETSLWDVGNWDEMYWDYNLYNPATYLLQIARFGRDGDSVNATLSSVPPDVNKRMEDINRNLEKQQTVNNPDTPIE